MDYLSMAKGEDRDVDVAVKLRNEPDAIDGDRLVWTVRDGASTVFTKTTDDPAEIEVTDASEGEALIHILDSDTASIVATTRLDWELWLTRSGSDVQLAEGRLLVRV